MNKETELLLVIIGYLLLAAVVGWVVIEGLIWFWRVLPWKN